MSATKGRTVSVAGSTGDVGRTLVRLLAERGDHVIAVGRDADRLGALNPEATERRAVDYDDEQELERALAGTDVVVSCIGLRRAERIEDYERVHVETNRRLLSAAERAGVEGFLFLSVLGVERDTDMCAVLRVKRAFELELQESRLRWVILRPSGFFSDLGSGFLRMARKGRAMMIGKQAHTTRFSPIHTDDVAAALVEHLDRRNEVVEFGGPEEWTLGEVFELCFELVGNPPAYRVVPVWLFDLLLTLARPMLGVKVEFMRFARWAMTHDLTAAPFGERRLREYLEAEVKRSIKPEA